MDQAPKITFTSVDEYVAAQPEHVQELLVKLRSVIRQTAPEAKELISYGMPAFKTGRMLAYYAAHKAHIGFYPASVEAINRFRDELISYKTTKGGIQFPFERGIPEALVERIIQFRLVENELKLKAKKK